MTAFASSSYGAARVTGPCVPDVVAAAAHTDKLTAAGHHARASQAIRTGRTRTISRQPRVSFGSPCGRVACTSRCMHADGKPHSGPGPGIVHHAGLYTQDPDLPLHAKLPRLRPCLGPWRACHWRADSTCLLTPYKDGAQPSCIRRSTLSQRTPVRSNSARRYLTCF